VLAYAVLHESGEERSGEYPLPDPTSARPQDIGSAITYARRYSFCAVTGLVTEEDDDGNLAAIGPEQGWAALAGQVDQRLLRQGDWPALAQLMQRVDDQGHDVAAIIRAVTRTPLTDLPAQDLRYRIVAHLDLCVDLQRSPVHTSTAKTTTRPRPHREAAASVLATTRTPLVDQTRLATASNCRRASRK
jgi:hypothetical protein